jgi:tetratricopeptide (TPR) repeat protein
MASDPDNAALPKSLGFALMSSNQCEDAVPVWRDFIKAHPDDVDGPANLGICFSRLGRHTEAVSTLEAAVKIHPDRPDLQNNLGVAYLKANQKDKAIAVFTKLGSLHPDKSTLNNVAYVMANADLQLPLALDYAQRAVRDVEEASQNITLANLTMQDVGQLFDLSAYWDTLGWVYERMSKLDLAESYLRASWKTTQDGVVAGHLCHLYRRTHQTSLAIQMCRMAIYQMPTVGIPGSEKNTELAAARENLDFLLHGPDKSKRQGSGDGTGDAASKISEERTFKLSRFLPGTESAEFWVLLSSDGKSKSFTVEDVKFISGSDKMKPEGKQIKNIDFKVPAPSEVPARFVRRGILGCYRYTGCSFVLLDPTTVHSLD